MKRDEKKKQAEELRELLQRARTIILSGFEGLTVAQDTELRRQVAQAGGKYRVVKNSVIERAAQGTPVEAVAGKLQGTTSLAYTEAEPVNLAKALVTYAKENPALVFRTGLVEGRVVSLQDVTVIASLPSRDDLFAKVLYLINAPARRLATTVAGVARNLACVIQQGVKEKKFKEIAGS
ncbi:MAG: 50S ribosomal protein L10 [Acidobacteria bacterium]|nr:50S ribosomal protein L10 [Acidobacteriota bacterium]MBI1982878.1 50S ribosomal protein L10 [Acidobacteriota bacterium]